LNPRRRLACPDACIGVRRRRLTFMNLIFSLQSACTASLILMSQNRQDRLKAHNDYLMNLRAEEELHAVLDNFAAQNKALEEIYQELFALRNKIEKPD
jgi:uncharacterized membrane protein